MTDQSQLPAERPSKPVVADDVVWIMDTNRFEHMYRIATAMAAAKLMPEHLRNSPPDCMLVVEQSNRWGMSPFAVAQCTFAIGGKLGYEGKLVAAVVNTRGNLKRRLSYTYEGSADDRNSLAVVVSGTIQGEDQPRTVRVSWKQGDSMSKGAKDKWASQPEQQLAYFGARAWARRHMPEVLLGVYTPDEIAAGLHNEMRDVTPKAEERRIAMRDPEPELVELTTADGEIVHKLRGEVEQFLVHQIDEIMDLETLDAFVGLNSLQIAQRPVLEDRIEQIRERLSIKAAPPEPEVVANGNGASKARAMAIAAALKEAPTLDALQTLFRRRDKEIASMPDNYRTRMLEIYHEELQRHAGPMVPADDPMAELADLDGLPPLDGEAQGQENLLVKFLHHFKIGEPIAGENFNGILIDADDNGIFFDMEDGGTTFLTWNLISRVWSGPPAERAVRHRKERRIDHEVSDEQMRKALDAAYDVLKNGDPTCRPALSEDEIRELLGEHVDDERGPGA